MLGLRTPSVLAGAMFLHVACSVTPTFVSSTGSSGAGGAAPCSTAADCPGSDDDCAEPACAAGVCTSTFKPAGTVALTQVFGDCATLVCDGAGSATQNVDDTDIPDDGSDCTEDRCTNGVPENLHLPAGTTCGPNMDLACDGAGACVGCTKDADCPLGSNCAPTICDQSQTCSTVLVPAGPAPMDTPGDCALILCDGNGGEVLVPDDTDPSDDGDLCTDDVCSNGSPKHVENYHDGNYCTQDTCDPATGVPGHSDDPNGTPCGMCQWCQQGSCVTCEFCDPNGSCT